jgi:hypothetical protein
MLRRDDDDTRSVKETNDPECYFERNETSTIPVDLQPPVYNLRKESILFDETSATLYKNNMARLWILCQHYFPRIVHGGPRNNRSSSSSSTSLIPFENDSGHPPIAYLYNMFFVRIPIIMTGIFYLYQLYHGHPFVCDFGFYGKGPFEVPPYIVLGILYVLLL